MVCKYERNLESRFNKSHIKSDIKSHIKSHFNQSILINLFKATVKDINREYNEVESALNRLQTHKGVQGR